jgi:ParB family chromosome partitioning protein
MRTPWNRTKLPQLELLDSPDERGMPVGVNGEEPAALTDAKASEMPGPDAVVGGRPMNVSLFALYEDPANPRTEFPEAELDELAEDIRRHGILQPIVVHPVDETGRFRIHFGAKRFRAAARAGLSEVPIVVREAAADPYAQVAENQKRHGLSPLDLARFIRSRVALGETNAVVARRLGMDLTTVAHHLALLDLPPVLDAALKSGRCSAPRTLYELSKVHADRPEAIRDLLDREGPITREAVAALRKPVRRTRSKPVVGKKPGAKPLQSSPAVRFASRAERLCTQLTAVCSRLRAVGFEHLPADDLAALRARVSELRSLLEP